MAARSANEGSAQIRRADGCECLSPGAQTVSPTVDSRSLVLARKPTRHAFTRVAAFGNLGNPVLCRNFVLKMGQLACLGEMECIDQLRDWKQQHARAHSSLSIRHLESHNGDIERSLFTPAGAAFFELL